MLAEIKNLEYLAKIYKENDAYTNQLKECEEKYNAILLGKMDDEIKEELETNKEKQNTDNNIEKEKRNLKIVEKKEKEKLLQDHYDAEKTERKNTEKDYRFFLKKMQKIEDSLPNYIRRNLKEMPNNKGYIWKDCWFFGELPPEKNQPQIMFEKLFNNVLRIHEYDQTDYKIYEKENNNPKRLILTRKRKKRNNIMDEKNLQEVWNMEYDKIIQHFSIKDKEILKRVETLKVPGLKKKEILYKLIENENVKKVDIHKSWNYAKKIKDSYSILINGKCKLSKPLPHYKHKRLYHATSFYSIPDIYQEVKILPSYVKRELGKGFYCTDSLNYAYHFANSLFKRGAIIIFDVNINLFNSCNTNIYTDIWQYFKYDVNPSIKSTELISTSEVFISYIEGQTYLQYCFRESSLKKFNENVDIIGVIIIN